MQLPDDIVVSSMENTGAQIKIATQPDEVDGDDQSGQCESDDAIFGTISCSCADGFFKAGDGTCVADDLPLVKSEAFKDRVFTIHIKNVFFTRNGQFLNAQEKYGPHNFLFWDIVSHPKLSQT